ncbi:MAG TPA: bi-domain-containing oxidoreductase [Cyclobacteriaceae bacterium]|nr:bi-domain-containing oxidoreductase [Cyclobacteriaceae bacterium]
MKQIIQDLQSGTTILADVPAPIVKRGAVLIQTKVSLVSLGTERMLVEFGKANLIEKARQQPEKVKQVLDKIKSDGLLPTLDAVFKKLAEPLPLGYCNAGEVIAIGDDVTEFKVGDRVVSNGPHAEIVLVPKNLVAKIPENVSYEEASFTVISAIGLQGIRLVNPTFGETIVVIGLGLIGLVTCQLLRANGCRVIGFDFDDQKVNLANNFGVQAFKVSKEVDPVKICNERTNGIGADGVIITASTQSDEVISQAAQMCRKRGRIVLVGVIGLDVKRSDFYEKELSFQVSCSYGPGRYDENYEQKGVDYPLPYVRWTEKRNFEAILEALSAKTLHVQPLITESIEVKDFKTIYEDIGSSKSIASIMRYSPNLEIQSKIEVTPSSFETSKAVFGVIGAGNFTKMVIVPTMRKLNYDIKYVASEKGLSSSLLAKKYKIAYATSDYREILKDEQVDAVAITVRHNLHAPMILEALKAKKHVFVEKPLALSIDEITQIEEAYQSSGKSVTVGFNRRFSPFARKAKELIKGTGAINVIATMNAGFIPDNSWVHDMKIGGGRIIGEACHLVDLITFFAGSLVDEVMMTAQGTNPEEDTDNASLTLKYKNGSLGVINYFSNGSKAYAKERVEIYSQGRTILIDNYRKLKCFGFSSRGLSQAQDKGHYDQFKLLQERLREGGLQLIPFDEIINTSKTVVYAIESLRSGKWIKVN